MSAPGLAHFDLERGGFVWPGRDECPGDQDQAAPPYQINQRIDEDLERGAALAEAFPTDQQHIEVVFEGAVGSGDGHLVLAAGYIVRIAART